MALIFEPRSPWHWLITTILVSVLVALFRRAVSRRPPTYGSLPATRWAVVILSSAAALMLVSAAWNPLFVRYREASEPHLVVVLDVSDSVLRAPGGWAAVASGLALWLSKRINARLPESGGRADVVTFRGEALVSHRNLRLEQLSETLIALDERHFAAGRGSRLEVGLDVAGDLILGSAGHGTVLLVSDGNQTDGDALAAARRLSARGVPVLVYPLVGNGAPVAITAADLPQVVGAGSLTYLRGMLLNHLPQSQTLDLRISRNPALPADETSSITSSSSAKTFELSRWGRFRQALRFEGKGIQFVDLEVSLQGAPSQKRRLFTFVERPAKLLSIGGDHRWAEVFSHEQATIDMIGPREFSEELLLMDYDAVIISGVPAHDLSEAALNELAAAITKKGLGFFLINGDHAGSPRETESVLMSYRFTQLNALLPVHSGPRPFSPDTPGRQVVMLLDASGSMAGPKLAKTKEIAAFIVQYLLRAKDRLDLIVFTDGVRHLLKDRFMDSAGKEAALEHIAIMQAGGGTDPKQALELIADRRLMRCGLILISDGGFRDVAQRPDCRATVFAVGQEVVPESSPLWALADPFPAPLSFDPSSIKIPYFQPERRNKFFEPGSFVPLKGPQSPRVNGGLILPEAALNGTAISHIRERCDLMSVRPKFTDPVLAFSQSAKGRVGVFTSGLPEIWLKKEQTRAAVRGWIRWVLAFDARDRYFFKLTDRGNFLDLRLELADANGAIPRVSEITAMLDQGEGKKVPILLRPVPTLSGTFVGRIPLQPGLSSRLGTLSLEEAGPDALSRVQTLPLVFPPTEPPPNTHGLENASRGTHESLLRALAATGSYQPALDEPLFGERPPAVKGLPLWPWLLVAAMMFYLAGISRQRFSR